MRERIRRDVPERRILRAGLIGAVCAWLLFLGVLVQDGGLLHQDVFGNFYAAQADALNHGHWNVNPNEAAFEGFAINGKVYLYFGPAPAIVRMPIEALTSRFHGRLTRLSMLLAEAVLLAFVIRLIEVARRAARPRAPSGRLDALVTGLFVFAAGASSTVYLAGQSWGVPRSAHLGGSVDHRLADHVGGVPAVAPHSPPRLVWCAGCFGAQHPWRDRTWRGGGAWSRRSGRAAHRDPLELADHGPPGHPRSSSPAACSSRSGFTWP